jgi:hypothetical protein
MAASIDLKWGSIKGWDGMEEGHPARIALEKWMDSGQGMSAMQRQTEEQRKLICDVIDAVNGGTMTKEAAKKYVMEYGLTKSTV